MLKGRRLARSISDLAWGMFIRQLKYKCKWRGRSLRVISRWFPSSKMCSECGEINERLTLADREWTCPCGARHDRDHNAAKNILKVGRDTPDYKPVATAAVATTPAKKRASGDAGSRSTQAASQTLARGTEAGTASRVVGEAS
jgi:putative transposase